MIISTSWTVACNWVWVHSC